jgi:DNA polymerase
MSKNTLHVRQALVQQLESLERAGVMQLAKAKPKTKRAKPAPQAAEARPQPAKQTAAAAQATGQTSAKAAARSTTKPAAGTESKGASPSVAPTGFPKLAPAKETSEAARPRRKLSKSAVAEQLAVLSVEVAGCTQCKELARTRTQTVFGGGNPQPRLCFLGEAPGADEDRLGQPFVGRSGELLTNIIEACKLKREDVYILNILKCRPPGNRLPLPNEAANCRGFLERQLELLQPEFICCLGACAAHNLLQTDIAIGKLRGQFYEYGNARVLCTYHPAYLLRNPPAKKYVWEDMKLLMREMGMPVE